MLATILPMLFVACNNEEESTSKIVGRWELVGVYFSEEDRWYNAETDIETLHELEFRSNGSGQFNDYNI